MEELIKMLRGVRGFLSDGEVFISRRRHEEALLAKDTEIAELRRRIFVLRDNMLSAAWRLNMTRNRYHDGETAIGQLNRVATKDMERDLER